MGVLKGSLPDLKGAEEQEGAPEPAFKAAAEEAAVEPSLPTAK